jgi:hypothetical protein
MKLNSLIFLSLSSLCLVSGYAWSDRLDRYDQFSSDLYPDVGAESDGIENTKVGSDTMPEGSKGGTYTKQTPSDISNPVISDQESEGEWKPTLQNSEGIHELYRIR